MTLGLLEDPHAVLALERELLLLLGEMAFYAWPAVGEGNVWRKEFDQLRYTASCDEDELATSIPV